MSLFRHVVLQQALKNSCTFKFYKGRTIAIWNSNLLLFQQLNAAFTVRGQFLVSHTAGKEIARLKSNSRKTHHGKRRTIRTVNKLYHMKVSKSSSSYQFLFNAFCVSTSYWCISFIWNNTKTLALWNCSCYFANIQ